MVLKGRITTSFGRIARTTSLVSTQSLSAAPRAKNWSRYRIFSIFFSEGFSRKTHGVIVRDLWWRTHLILFLDLVTVFSTRFMVQNHRIQRIIVPEENSEGSRTADSGPKYFDVKSNNSWSVHILTVLTQFLARTRVYWSEGVQRMRQIDIFIILRFGSEIFWRK